VEILYKPHPGYTQEARALRIEGEVQLEVMFMANGNLRIEHTVAGLGHGLDQMAMQAAQQIRFRPATQDGQPCDSRATVHIVFQLAD
jgi:TonB family protein